MLRRPDGSEQVLPPMFSIEIEAGDVYEHRTAGGGGWGDPRRRDPAAVAEDVLNEKVTPEAALALYGVVVAADGSAERSSA